MKDKDKELLLSKITKLKGHLEAYPHLHQEFPQLDGMIQKLHEKVAYGEVKEKTGGLELHKHQLDDLESFASQLSDFKDAMASLSLSGGVDSKYLTLEMIQDNSDSIVGAIEKIKSASDPVFADCLDKMIAYVNGLNAGVNAKELAAKFSEIATKEYSMVNFNALRATTSLKAVKEMKLPILDDHFFANYKAYYKGKPSLKVPSATAIAAAIEKKFAGTYVMTEKDFADEISAWVKHMKNDIAKLVSHQFGACEIALDIVAKDCFDQMGTLVSQHPVFVSLQVALNSAIKSAAGPDITKLSDFASKMGAALDKLGSITVTIDLLQNVNEEKYFSSRLIPIVTLGATALKSINTNSPYYIVGQPNFRANLRQKLNEWKEAISTALGVASRTVLELDGASFSAASFKTNMLQGISNLVPSIKDAFSALALQDISLKGHSDLDSFNTQWETPWRALVSAINMDAFIESTVTEVELQAHLYTNMYDILPSQDDVLTAFLGCISGKMNLALEQAIANRNEMRAGFEQVNERIDQVEDKVDELGNKVDDMQADINEMKSDINQLKKGQEKILKKLDELPKSDTNINVDVDVNVDDLLDVVVNPEDITFDIKTIIQDFISQADMEREFFNFDEKITLAKYLIFTAYATYGATLNASLKNEVIDSGFGIQSTGNVNFKAFAGLRLAALSVCGYDLAAVEGRLNAYLMGEAIARLTATKETLIEGGLQASLTLAGTTEFKFETLGYELYKIESDQMNILVIKTPIYTIGFQVSTWKYQGAKRKGGDWVCDLHPDLKAAFKKAKDVLSDPMTYVELGIEGAAYVVETVGDYAYSAAETIYDGVGSVVSYLNPFD